jgi:very-short-patch-repair endonuclease
MKIRKHLAHLNDAELEELLTRLYVTEEKSLLAISEELGVSREFVSRWLTNFNVPLRSASSVMKLRHSNMTSEERKALASKAHEAVRGSNRFTHSNLIRSMTVNRKAKMSKWEKWFAKWLIDADMFDFVFSFPIDVFNIDFAFPEHKIAIEIDGGSWHTTDRKRAQDTKKDEFLTSEGWRVYRVPTYGWKNKVNEYSTAFHRKSSEVIEELTNILG